MLHLDVKQAEITSNYRVKGGVRNIPIYMAGGAKKNGHIAPGHCVWRGSIDVWPFHGRLVGGLPVEHPEVCACWRVSAALVACWQLPPQGATQAASAMAR